MKPTTDVVEVPRFDFLPRPRRLTQTGETRLDARVSGEAADCDAISQRFPTVTLDKRGEDCLESDPVEWIAWMFAWCVGHRNCRESACEVREFVRHASSRPSHSLSNTRVPAKKKPTDKPLAGADLIKEVNRRIRAAKSLWDAHNNAACRGERDKAIALYETLTHEQREKVPEQLRVWLRYRSEKYFGPQRTPP